MKKLTISLVSGRSADNIRKCLETLKIALPENVSSKLVVTDNCSEWDVESLVKSEFPDAEIIRNPSPLGFGRNHNNALLDRDDDYALIINDDIEIDPAAVSELLRFAENKEKGAIFGPILFPGSWDAQYISAGGRIGERMPKPILNGVSLLIRFFFGDNMIRSILGGRNKNKEAHDGQKAYISGACCLVKREYIKKHGLYDPEYYMYFDDIDLGKRARLNGFECWQVAAAKVMHLEGGSFSRRTWLWIADSNLRYSRKFHSFPVTLTAMVLTGILKFLLKFKGR